MKIWPIALLILSCSIGYCQETKTKKTFSYLHIENYTIHKGNKKKEGKYIKLRKSDKDTLVVGTYKNDMKSGLWTYKAGKNGDNLIYDYDNGSIVKNNAAKADSFFVKVDSSFIFTKVDSPPVYIGYEDEIIYWLASNVDVSQRIMEGGISGYTQAYMIIDKLGRLDRVGIEKSLDPDLDKNILKSMRMIDGQWIPAKRNGQAVDAKIYVLVNVTSGIPIHNIKQQPYLLIVDLVYYGVTQTTRSTSITVRGNRPSRD